MSAVHDNIIYLNSGWIENNFNQKSKGSLLDRTVKYLKRGSGSKRVLKIIQKVSRIIYENGHTDDKLRKLDEGIGLTGSLLGITRLPHTLRGAYKSISALGEKDDGISFARKAVESVRDTTDAMSALSSAFAFVFNNTPAGVVGQVTGIVSDTADFQLTASDLGKATTLEKRACGEVKNLLNHTKKYYLLRLIQCIVGLATGILALTMLATGSSFIPSLAWISISLAMVVFSIGISFFKNSKPYKIVTFEKNVQLAS